jgi:nucleoside-diphosphate-sugar epimerase
MQITITGGTGSLAEYVINELKGAYQLVSFDRVADGENRFAYPIEHPIVIGDLTDFAACQRAVAGSQAIVHLGAIASPTEHPDVIARRAAEGRPPLPWDETFRVNTMGTYYLLEAARRAGVKTVVTITSNCVLGHGFRLSGRGFPLRYLPIDEAHPTDGEDSYSLSKLLTEEIMQSYSRAYGLRCYALRPAGVWRPERTVEYARGYQPPTAWSDWLYGYNDIRDVARAIRLCLEAAAQLPPFAAFYLNATDTTVLEDSRALVERLRPELAPLAAGLVGRQALISAAKAERLFGWRAQHSWTTALPG